jgi:hypothetical protein
MPVSTAMVCDFDSWAACSREDSLTLSSSGMAPPSRLRASWILVSLVSRLMIAERMRGEEDMVACMW